MKRNDPGNNPETRYGAVRSASELGHLVREHRKDCALSRETVSAIGGFSMRFLSEFERGKETAELGKVLAALATLGLDVFVEPRRTRAGDDSEGAPGNETADSAGGT